MTLHPVDIHVGKKLRARRTILGRSQEEIGKSVGVTFQQIQKYERGINRMGSSRLYEIAKILDVNISYFFDDFYSGKPSITPPLIPANASKSFNNNDIDNKEVLSLVRSYYGITNAQVRKKILALMRSISDIQDEDEILASPSTDKKLANV